MTPFEISTGLTYHDVTIIEAWMSVVRDFVLVIVLLAAVVLGIRFSP